MNIEVTYNAPYHTLEMYLNNFFRAQFPNLTLTNHSKIYVPKLGQKIKNKNFSMNQYFL